MPRLIDEPLLNYLPIAEFSKIERLLEKSKIVGKILTEDDAVDRPSYESISQICDRLITIVRKSHNIFEEIRFVLVDSPTNNALALYRGSLNCVVISLGYMVTMGLSIDFLLTSKNFQKIWKLDEEFEKILSVGSISRQEGIRKVFFEYRELEDDEDRSYKMMALSQFCIEFIMLHELGHIVNGHLRSGVLSTGYIGESDAHFDEDIYLNSRCIEFDADCFAVQLCLRLAVFRPEMSDPKWVGYPLAQKVDLSVLSMLAAISIVIFSMESNYVGPPGVFHDKTHPPAVLRNWTALRTAIAVLNKIQEDFGLIEFNITDVVTRAHVGVFLAISELSGCGLDYADLEIWDDVAKEHETLNLKRWAKLRPKLAMAKFGTHNLAPAQY